MACACSTVAGARSGGSGAKRSRRSCASKRCFAAGVDMMAGRAFPLAAVESGKKRREIGDDVLYVDLDAVHEAGAFRAVPLEGVVHVVRTDFLDHQADGPR